MYGEIKYLKRVKKILQMYYRLVTRMEENYIIEINNLTKNYKMYNHKRDRIIETLTMSNNRHHIYTAIDQLNLKIKQGEVVGILGKNGAGKSTLLKMITGVTTPSNGDIKVRGKISSLLELGAAFNMELTGIENIYQHGQVMGLSNEEIKAKEQEIIDFADIGEHIYQPVKTYSSGMFARLAFSCAINVDPEILIVDEVLSVGDMAFQLKCFKKFEQFKEAGKSIIFVSHNIGDILRNCNRAIVLKDGKKEFDGNVKDGVEFYKKQIAGTSNNKYLPDKVKEKFTGEWCKKMNINPDVIVYGNGAIDIIDFGIFNSKGELDSTITNNDNVSIKLKAQINQDIECPTFSMTIKNFNGQEICGSNTNFMKIYTGNCKAGEVYQCEFTQKLMLAPGKYTLSLSCSRFDANGEIVVLNRNYDLVIFEVLANRNIVGYYDINSKISVNKI